VTRTASWAVTSSQSKTDNNALGQEAPPTPTTNPQPAEHVKLGEFYWGFGSGVVVAKIPGWGELVIAELTLSFDQAMSPTFSPVDRHRARLGFRPVSPPLMRRLMPVCLCFLPRDDDPDAFAAVPFSERVGTRPKAAPLAVDYHCALPINPCALFTYTDRTT
jgi:hypothetical protein